MPTNRFKFSLANLLLAMLPVAIAAFAIPLVGMPSVLVVGTIGISAGIGTLAEGSIGMVKGFLYGVPLGVFVLFMFYGVALLLVLTGVIRIWE